MKPCLVTLVAVIVFNLCDCEVKFRSTFGLERLFQLLQRQLSIIPSSSCSSPQQPGLRMGCCAFQPTRRIQQPREAALSASCTSQLRAGTEQCHDNMRNHFPLNRFLPCGLQPAFSTWFTFPRAALFRPNSPVQARCSKYLPEGQSAKYRTRLWSSWN